MQTCFKCGKILEKSIFPRHGLHPKCFKEWFQLADEQEDFKDLNPHSNQQPLQNTTFFHGKYKKYSASLAHKEYILKFSDEFPELAKAEYLCNQIGKLLGLNIPQSYLISFLNRQDCFLTYNFMQDYKGSDLKHIYHFLKPGEDAYTIENIIEAIKMRTEKHIEITHFINICLFDALVGNNDRHGRNLGLISSANGYTLSPCYDNPSHLAIADENWLGITFNISGTIRTQSSERPSIKEYSGEFIRLGYKNNVEDFLKKIKCDEISTLIENSFISGKRKAALTEYIKKKQEELKNAL